MSFTILENRSLKGFGWINYNRSEHELSYIANKILKYKFEREALKIYIGGNTLEDLTYDEWEERCKELWDTFFTRGGESAGVILFPDTKITLQSQVETWQRVMSTLNAWCISSSSKGAIGLIIRNYNLKGHFDFCGVKKYDIKNVLGLKSSEKMFNFQKSNERILAFNPSLKIILIVRLVESLDCDMQLLIKEVDYCIDEVNFLCFLLKDELEDTGIIVTGLVGYSGGTSHRLSACKNCYNFVVPLERLVTAKTFLSFWELFAKGNLEKFRASLRPRKFKANSFQTIGSKLIGFLAHLQFEMLQKPILPVLKNNPVSNIKEAKLLLDRYQMEIAYSADKRLWLEGNYGTGKTVVALKKLELLLTSLKHKEVIYYVNFSGKSLLDFKVGQKFKKNDNVRVIRGGFSLSNIIKTQVLPKEIALGTKSINLIVDEYSKENLSTKEARIIDQILKEEEKFKNATVLIAAQPMEIRRYENFYDLNGVKRTLYQESKKFDELIKIMHMNVRTLKNVMRTTVQINTLVEITQQYLDAQSNQYVRKEQRYEGSSNPPEKKEGRFQILFSKLSEKLSLKQMSSSSSVSGNLSNGAASTPPFQFKEIDDDFVVIDSSSSYENASSKLFSAALDDSSNPATSNQPSQSQKIVDYDELYRLMPTEVIADKKNYLETVTKYRYTCVSQIGHNISGPKPQLIKLAKSADECEQVALIASVLHEIIKSAERKLERAAVIHFEIDDPPLWLKTLFQITNVFSSLTMTTDVKTFLMDTSKFVLVKNMSFVKGLEFSDVLLVLDSNEYYLKHFIPEAIARCMGNLSILIRPSVLGNHKSNTVADLVADWENNNLDDPALKVHKIELCSKPSCIKVKDHRKAYCINEASGSFGVHTNKTSYLNLLKKIKHTYDQDMQPDYIAKREEAKAL